MTRCKRKTNKQSHIRKCDYKFETITVSRWLKRKDFVPAFDANDAQFLTGMEVVRQMSAAEVQERGEQVHQ